MMVSQRRRSFGSLSLMLLLLVSSCYLDLLIVLLQLLLMLRPEAILELALLANGSWAIL